MKYFIKLNVVGGKNKKCLQLIEDFNGINYRLMNEATDPLMFLEKVRAHCDLLDEKFPRLKKFEVWGIRGLQDVFRIWIHYRDECVLSISMTPISGNVEDWDFGNGKKEGVE